jgi:hypothetical protein
MIYKSGKRTALSYGQRWIVDINCVLVNKKNVWSTYTRLN